MATISQLDMNLPVAIAPNGNFVSAQDFVTRGDVQLLGQMDSFKFLAPESKQALTIARIEAKPERELHFIGGDVVGKVRAIEEVKAETPLGQLLMELEGNQIATVQRILQRQLAAANNLKAM